MAVVKNAKKGTELRLNIHYFPDEDNYHIVDRQHDETFSARPLYRNGEKMSEEDAILVLSKKYVALNQPDFTMNVWQKFDYQRILHDE